MHGRGSESKSPHTPEKIHDLLGAEAKRIAKLRLAMADVALDNSGQQHDQLIAAAEGIVENAQSLLTTTRKLEVVEFEPFGGEESYWTVFRMFTRDGNLGSVLKIEDIWELLSKNYDMSEETLDTLQATLVEWADDIAADAQEKGIRGKFIAQRAGFVFAEMHTPKSNAETETNQDEKAAESEDEKSAEEIEPKDVELNTAQTKLLKYITVCIQRSDDGSVKQASVKKVLLNNNPHLSADLLQVEIDSLVEGGRLFKFKRGKVAFLSLEQKDDEVDATPDRRQEHEKKEEIDLVVARKIIETLCGPRRHYQQKMTINDLWRVVSGSHDKSQRPPDKEIEQLKVVCRQLANKGLVTAGGEKMGTGGTRTKSGSSSKRRRSSSMLVYKVGLQSQEVKETLQTAVEASTIDRYLSDVFAD